jgi:tetratricopeptide (TPR) repeat protein
MAFARTQRRLATVLPLVLVIAFAGVPARVRADDAPHLAEPGTSERAAPPEAISHYELGREHFRAGRYGEAIVELKAALALDPDSANLRYNVAYTSELLGKLDEAIDYYAKYLKALPDSAQTEREKTRLTIERLRGRLSEQATEPVSQSAPSEPRASAGRADVWFWAALSGGAALLAGGGVTGVLALKREDDASNFVVGKDGSLEQHRALIDQANTFALSSDLLFAGGAALVVGSALLFFLRDPSPEHASKPIARAALSTDGKSALLTLRGAF